MNLTTKSTFEIIGETQLLNCATLLPDTSELRFCGGSKSVTSVDVYYSEGGYVRNMFVIKYYKYYTYAHIKCDGVCGQDNTYAKTLHWGKQ